MRSSPVLVIARKEVLDHLLSLKFHASMAVLAALLGLSAFVMYRDYQLRMDNYSVMKQRAQPRPGEYGVMAVVEPNPLSVFAKGLDETMTRGYTVAYYTGVEPRTRQTPPDSLFALFAAPDLLYIVKILLSLIALLFAYDAVSGEREAGTLKLVLSGGVSRAQFVTGKLLGGFAALMVPFLVALCAILAALATRPGLHFTSDHFVRLGLMVAAALVYLAVFFSLGLLVSARARTSAGALMMLLFTWAALVFAFPNLGNLVAEQLRPVPSAETQEMARRAEFVKDRFMDVQGGDKPAVRAQNIAQYNRVFDRMVESYRAGLDSMVALSKSVCRISPAATLTYVMTDLAGTGVAEQRRLSIALMDYKSRNLEAETARKTPAMFEFRRSEMADALERGALVDFAALTAVCGALFAASVFAFLRVDVR